MKILGIVSDSNAPMLLTPLPTPPLLLLLPVKLKMAFKTSQNNELPNAESKYANAAHTANITNCGLGNIIVKSNDNDGEKERRNAPRVRDGAVIVEGCCCLLVWSFQTSLLRDTANILIPTQILLKRGKRQQKDAEDRKKGAVVVVVTKSKEQRQENDANSIKESAGG